MGFFSRLVGGKKREQPTPKPLSTSEAGAVEPPPQAAPSLGRPTVLNHSIAQPPQGMFMNPSLVSFPRLSAGGETPQGAFGRPTTDGAELSSHPSRFNLQHSMFGTSPRVTQTGVPPLSATGGAGPSPSLPAVTSTLGQVPASTSNQAQRETGGSGGQDDMTHDEVEGPKIRRSVRRVTSRRHEANASRKSVHDTAHTNESHADESALKTDHEEGEGALEHGRAASDEEFRSGEGKGRSDRPSTPSMQELSNDSDSDGPQFHELRSASNRSFIGSFNLESKANGKPLNTPRHSIGTHHSQDPRSSAEAGEHDSYAPPIRHGSAKEKTASPPRDRHGAGCSTRSSHPTPPTEEVVPPPANVSVEEYKEIRGFIAERVVRMLTPRPLYGQVVKIRNIRLTSPYVQDELRTNDVLVRRIADPGGALYYAELEMLPIDAPPDAGGLVETDIELCTCRRGARLYTSTEQEALAVLETDPGVVTVYTTERHALLARDEDILTVAVLTVIWRPYSTPEPEAQCPVHNRALEIFDPVDEELACPLCSASKGRRMIVLSELTAPNMREELSKDLRKRAAEGASRFSRECEMQVSMRRAHVRAMHVVDSQFAALAAAVEAKRHEVLDQLAEGERFSAAALRTCLATLASFGQALETAGTLVSSGVDLHLRQLATVANVMQRKPPPELNDVPRVGLVNLNLEAATSAVQSVPFKVSWRSIDDSVASAGTNHGGGTPLATQPSPAETTTPKHSLCEHGSPRSACGAASLTENASAIAKSGTETPQGQRAAATSPRTARRQRVVPLCRRPATPARDQPLIAKRAGTSLFNFPLHELLRTCPAIEWRLRIEDRGDWLGVGVGIGGTLEGWSRGDPFDLRHLWTVPANCPYSVLALRVTTVGTNHVQLTVHRPDGLQINTDRIPQWNVTRTAYPQVSYGKINGVVAMIKYPAPIVI